MVDLEIGDIVLRVTLPLCTSDAVFSPSTCRGEAISVVVASLLDLYNVGERARSDSMAPCVGVLIALPTFALRADDRGVTLRPTPLIGVAAGSWAPRRGESILCCANEERSGDVVEDGEALLNGAARRGAGEERSDVVVVGSLGIRGRGGGEARKLRLVAAMLSLHSLHDKLRVFCMVWLIVPSATRLKIVYSRCAGSWTVITLSCPQQMCSAEVTAITSPSGVWPICVGRHLGFPLPKQCL